MRQRRSTRLESNQRRPPLSPRQGFPRRLR
jgi:hypothetical protein